jgi:Zn-dependent M32 family carboxypeptidase
VEASLIRVDADEVTYNLHVMLRFDLERGAAARRLEAGDVPEAWNARMRSDPRAHGPRRRTGLPAGRALVERA